MWPVSPEFLAAIRRRDQHTRPTFAPWWKPWRWCRARRCRLTRRHYGRHAAYDGFGIRYFDTRNEGTP